MPKKPYTTKEKLENFLGKTLTNDEADLAINIAIDIVEELTNRVWVADTVATPRKFGGLGTTNLPIDECIEITEVKRGLTEYGDSHEVMTEGGLYGYFLYPVNQTPIRALHLRGRLWMRGWGNNIITAKWGYAETVPDDISYATTVLAGGVINGNDSQTLNNVKSERIGNYQVTYGGEEGWSAYNRAKLILSHKKKYVI